jgi:dinuclear metal center YbgI/SA1388 family protein
MLRRTELEQVLKEIFQYENFQDYCQNGIQVEGQEGITKIAFGVSFNLPLLEKAIDHQADAIIVHHGFFGKTFFSVKGVMKEKIRLLLDHNISLFGIHLPLDAHEQYGNNAQLFSYLGVESIEPFEVGFIGNNLHHHSLTQMLEIFHQQLHPDGYQVSSATHSLSSVFSPKYRYGFLYFDNGPETPETMAIVSGNASSLYRSGEIVEKGIDTFICGNVDEPVPGISYETHTNFVNLGHYWSEKSGLLALQGEIERRFDVETMFIEIENVI